MPLKPDDSISDFVCCICRDLFQVRYKMKQFIQPMRIKKELEMEAPMTEPILPNLSRLSATCADMAIAMIVATTMVECPKLKKRPTVTGLFNRYCPAASICGTETILLVALSMASDE